MNILICLMYLTLLIVAGAANPQKIKVIGAGLPRTGTSSLKEALDILGYKTYHFQEILRSGDNAKPWIDFLKRKTSIDEVFNQITTLGYNATLDFPTSEYFKEQISLYPNAKVILTVRNKPQDWSKSVTTLLDFRRKVFDAPFSWYYPNFFYYLPTISMSREILCLFGAHLYDLKNCELAMHYHEKPREWLDGIYEKHTEIVLNTVPKDRLLILNAKDGWEPLCNFLGLPVPSIPYPTSNSSAFLTYLQTFFQILVYLWIPFSFFIIRRIFKFFVVGNKSKEE